MKKTLTLVSALILASCSQIKVEQFIEDKGIPDIVLKINDNNLTLMYDYSLSMSVKEDYLTQIVCGIKFNVDNNTVTNPKNSKKECEEFKLKQGEYNEKFNTYTKQTIEGAKIKMKLKNMLSSKKN